MENNVSHADPAVAAHSVPNPGRLGRRGFLKTTAALAAWATVGAPRIGVGAPGGGSASEIGSEPQLFLDDWIVERSDGLRRVLHSPDKQGLIKNADGSDWDLGSVYGGNIVCRDARGGFHMTYRYSWWDPAVRDLHPSIGEDKAHWFRESIAYATSEDGIRWTKPRLGLLDGPTGFREVADFPFSVPAGMSRDNNLGCPFDFAYDLAAHGNRADPGQRFLLRRVRMEDTHPFAKPISAELFFAPDWPDLVNDARWSDRLVPIPGGQLSPRGFKQLAGFDHDAGEWFAVSQDVISNWLKHNGRDIARYSTRDLRKWHGPEPTLAVAADESREPADWIEYMDLLAYRVGGQKSGAWLGQLVIFHSDRTNPQYAMPRRDNVWRKGTTELRLVISRDAGRTWQRVGDKGVWLPCNADSHGLDRLVFATHPLRVGDEAWFYYCAWNGDHLVFNRDGSLFESRFLRTHRTARATLRWNGYVSLDTGRNGGALVTRPFRFAGSRLLLNLRAPAEGITVELQDESGNPLSGFAAGDSLPVRGDGVDLPVSWRSDRPLKSLEGKTVRLKFALAQSAFYGFRFAS